MALENILQEFRKPYPERKHTGLERMKHIMDCLGNPQDSYKSVHIAGTNGKGSVSAMIHNFFCEAGVKTGLFTSPHLERFTERIRVNHQEIPEPDFLRILKEKVLAVVNNLDEEKFGSATEFEVINAVAFCYFAEQNAEMAVIEVGLGGKLDSTNILNNILCSVITSISMDHTDRLGSTLAEISREKAGIIREDTAMITSIYNKYPEIFLDKSKNIYFANPDKLIINDFITDSLGTEIRYPKCAYKIKSTDEESIFYNQEISLPLIGIYQRENLSIVLKCLELIYQKAHTLAKIPVNKEKFIELSLSAIARTKWPGRFEFINYQGYILLLDGAHNNKAMQLYTENLKLFHSKYKVISIFACNKDKEYQNMLHHLEKVSDYIIVTQSHVQIKAQSPETMSEFLIKLNKEHQIVKDYQSVLKFAGKIISEKSWEKENVLINICGSLYLVGVIRDMINRNLL